MKYLDPKNDLTFKKVFGQHHKLLMSFLNALLPLKDDEQIVHLEYLPAELVPSIPFQKNTVVDVRCCDEKGRHFIVEMQMHWISAFMQRVLFNASKAYIKQLDKNEDFKYLQPVYALCLVNENFEKDIPEFYHHYKIVHSQYTEKQIKGLEFVFVELPKFKAKNVSEKKLQVLWLRFMTEIDEKTTEIDQALLENPEIRQAIDHVAESAFTPAELETYDKYWDIVRTEKTLMSGKRDEGFVAGMEKGREEGKIEERFLLAKRLKAKGISVSDISEMTGLSEEEIEKL